MQWMIGKIGVAYERTDTQATILRVFRPARAAADVMSITVAGRSTSIFHQVNQIGAAGEEFRGRIVRDQAYRVRKVG